MANVPGPQFGFQLRVLNLDEEVTYTSGLGYGFFMKVLVDNNSLQPRFFEEGVYVSAGQVSYICVRRTFVQNEPAPYTECIDLTSYSSELYDFITKTSNRVYRQKDCIDLCIQKYIIENCFCYYVLYDNPFGNTTGYCSSNSDVTCAENHKKDFPNVVDCISNYCPLECESIQYDYSVSSNIWPSYTMYKADADPDKLVNYDEYSQKMLLFYVYYNQLDLTLIQEAPATTLSNLIAGLGGTMGLIVSFSCLTFLELAELFFSNCACLDSKSIQFE